MTDNTNPGFSEGVLNPEDTADTPGVTTTATVREELDLLREQISVVEQSTKQNTDDIAKIKTTTESNNSKLEQIMGALDKLRNSNNWTTMGTGAGVAAMIQLMKHFFP